MTHKYRVIIGPEARKDFRKLPKPIKKRIVKTIKGLRTDPRPHGYKKLEGFPKEKFYRLHVGDYRVIYRIQDDVVTIFVLAFLKRNETTYKF